MADLTSIFHTLPFIFLVSLAVLCESVVVFLSGFSSDFWWIDSDIAFGLWRACHTYAYSSSAQSSACADIVDILPTYSVQRTRLWVVRVCCIASLITQAAAIVQLLMFAYKEPRKNYAVGAFASCASASALSIIGASVYLANPISRDSAAGWSSVMVLLSAIMQAHSAACIIVPVRRGQVAFVIPTTTLGVVGGQGQVMGYPPNQYYAAPAQGVPVQYQGAPPGTMPAPYVVQGAPQGNVSAQYPGHYQGAPQGQHQGAPTAHRAQQPLQHQGGTDTGSQIHLVPATSGN